MAYKKPLVTTTVYYHNGETPLVFADAITSGETTRDGSAVREQILGKTTVIGKATDNNMYVIPYHAVIYATVAVAESAEQTAPTDEFCE